MAKMFALKTILRRDKNGVEEAVKPKSVFDATPAEAKQLDALKSARPATDKEIAAHKEAQAKADGTAYEGVVDADTPNSEPTIGTAAPETAPGVPTNLTRAEGDPKGLPKGRST